MKLIRIVLLGDVDYGDDRDDYDDKEEECAE
jgi:hypothetical protein